MTRTAMGFLGLLVLLPALQARDKPETPTPSQQYQKLVKEYDSAEMEFRKAGAKLKTNDERLKLIKEKNPKERFFPRFLELAEKNAKDPAAVDALTWIVKQMASPKKSDPQNPRSRAIQILLRDHLQNEKMATLCQSQSVRFALDEDRRNLVRAVFEKGKHRPAQGQACFALAEQATARLRLIQQLNERPEMVKSFEEMLGKGAVQALVNTDLEVLGQEAESLYHRVIKEYGDLVDSGDKKLGELAKEKLDTLPYPIVVGKSAPEIEGEDIDGKKFKLSDYRGKVVLLDFWGNW